MGGVTAGWGLGQDAQRKGRCGGGVCQRRGGRARRRQQGGQNNGPKGAQKPGAGPGLLTVRRVDAEVDGHRRDALVGAGDPVGLSLDLQAHLLEVGELLPLAVQELGIFCSGSGVGWGGWERRWVTWVLSITGLELHPQTLPSSPSPQQRLLSVMGFYPHRSDGKSRPEEGKPRPQSHGKLVQRRGWTLLGGGVESWGGQPDCWCRRARTCGSIDQLQDQWASGDNARSSGQEVPAVSLR